ncbi:MAG: hypothetical protein KatS3mg051_0339 [Anaerolineae bacterium]|nr:MAG: hypothetical protein KatS3mg051_0339 [Anaerolineae bacterium]
MTNPPKSTCRVSVTWISLWNRCASWGQDRAYNITVKVQGGGITGQRDAIRLGVARALLKIEPEWRSILREGEHLSRDPRVKERKKPGLKRARKGPDLHQALSLYRPGDGRTGKIPPVSGGGFVCFLFLP